MALIWRQILQLYYKTILLTAVRHPFLTLLRALIFPIVLVCILVWTETALNPPQYFGIGTPSPILSLPKALAQSSPNRNTIAFIFDEKADIEITKVYTDIGGQVKNVKGKQLSFAASEDALPQLCKISECGSSNCYGAVIIHTSPNWPSKGGAWNYTIRSDETLGNSFDVRRRDNDAQIYVLPLQLALDQAIAKESKGKTIPSVQQYPYTEKSEEQREYDTHQSYVRTGVYYFSVIFFLSMVGIMYQATGLLAYEREVGLSELIEAMMPNKRRGVSKMMRLFAHTLAFVTIYLPGWLIISIIMAMKVYTFTNTGLIMLYHIYIGLALVASSLFGAVFFRKAQLSGIAVTVVAIIMAIIPQVLAIDKWSPITTLAMSAVYPSSCYTYFLLFIGLWEVQGKPATFLHKGPDPWPAIIPRWVLWVFPMLQIIIYPILAFCVESILYGTSSRGRKIVDGGHDDITVRLTGFCKTYKPSLFSFKKIKTNAVQSLDLTARKGQIYMLLGPNGSGKSTTMNAIAGLTTVSSGSIEVDGSGGLGITPQKNVLWDDLTVKEHARIFYNLKTAYSRANNADIDGLLEACDIKQKSKAKTKTLSGGQKRKIQLAMMFAGGSAVCCIDEASSGLDPLSRRKIWDILLAQRAFRTIILTTHFLDEADFLSDHISIISKGRLQAEGSTAELKDRYGKGCTIDASQDQQVVHRKLNPKKARSINVPTSRNAADVVNALEREESTDYKVAGPTPEDVFLQLTGSSLTSDTNISQNADSGHEMQLFERSKDDGAIVTVNEVKTLDLQTGRPLSGLKQTWVLFTKRLLVFKTKWGPHLSALIVALVGAGVSPLFVKNFAGMACVFPPDTSSGANPIGGYQSSLGNIFGQNFTGGPVTRDYANNIAKVASLYDKGSWADFGEGKGLFEESLQKNVTTLTSFTSSISSNRFSTPGGFWLGDANSAPVVAWSATQLSIYYPLLLQNIISNINSGIPICTTFSAFNDKPAPPLFDFGPILFCIYFSLVFCLYPAFYALYPSVERLRQARALQYSNGVRPLPMWQAYLAFDAIHVLVISAVATILLSLSANHQWYGLPFLFLVLFLYGIASTILGYIISLFAKSQLAAWAFCASGQAVLCLINFGVYLGVSTATDISVLNDTLMRIHYAIGFFSPIVNVQRSLFVSLNQFLILCADKRKPVSPQLYGTPIAYLAMQCILLFAILILWDSGFFLRLRAIRSNKAKFSHEEGRSDMSAAQAAELACTKAQTSGLRVMNLSKSFGKNKAVDDVTFGIDKSEIFALLGPNGAGKSTAISLIRGDIAPSTPNTSRVEIDQLSLLTQRASFRSLLGVCPQFDATDVLSVIDHLKFYASVRGVLNPAHNADLLLRAFNLTLYKHQLASKLSGGTKRKLSLAIAMAGNPAVLLLDEPSSGLDAASKRVMWRCLESVRGGRSVLLTTHSMEEADAIADRAGIMSGNILALDTCEGLRRMWGDVYHVHVVMQSAPHTNEDEMIGVKGWLAENIRDARVEEKSVCGQLRFSVPARTGRGVGGLFNLLENNRGMLGTAYYSIGETTLDQVFVNVVKVHGGVEDGEEEEER